MKVLIKETKMASNTNGDQKPPEDGEEDETYDDIYDSVYEGVLDNASSLSEQEQGKHSL